MRIGILLMMLVHLASCGGTIDVGVLGEQVRATERAFARTMAERDSEGFATFLSDEAVFFAGDEPLRGARAIADAWSGFFEGELAPFAWQPEVVEVLDSGTLALSSGPVYGPEGNLIATFNSVWRLEDGRWRIIFDRGAPAPCECR